MAFSEKPSILFMGTTEFALPALALLVERGYPVTGAVTQPDRPRGRGKKLSAPPVKNFALDHRIPVMQPERVEDESFLRTFRELSPQMVVLAAFGQILPGEILSRPERGCINIHPSLLPKYRGAAPVNRAIMAGEVKTGVTIMEMAAQLDAGDIIMQSETAIAEGETFDGLHARLALLGADLLLTALEGIIKGSAQKTPQDPALATYAPRLEKEECLIRWEMDVEAIVNLIHGLSSTPGAYTFFEGKKMKIFRAGGEAGEAREAPGTFCGQTGKGLKVAAANGYVHLLDLQPESRKRMSAEEFLRGNIIGSCRTGALK